jgi:phosphoribosyl 1,2-cyclic phosphodiesterase
MIVRFWGVRGSIPVPGADTVRFGGNTACVSIEAGGTVLVLDAGTGIKDLGTSLAGGNDRIVLLLSHPHWDHVMGMPFFAPLYEKGRAIDIVDLELDGRRYSPLEMLDGVHFPLVHEKLPSDLRHGSLEDVDALAEAGFGVTSLELNHPGGAQGFRIQNGDRVVVYMTDNEIDAPESSTTGFAELVDFCRGADVLCHDAQYLSGEHDDRWGWGHSALPRVCDLAIEAGVGHLVLFHHDPDRTDAQVMEMEAAARAQLEPAGIAATAAYEGLALEL